MARTDFFSAQPINQDLSLQLQDLSRLLERLQKRLDPTHNSRLRSSSYERNKVRANLEYARTLLIGLEHEQQTHSRSTKSAPQKASSTSARQGQLEEKRSLLRKLQHRLVELDQVGNTASDVSDAESDADNNQFWDRYAPAATISPSGIDHHRHTHEHVTAHNQEEARGSSTLRSRKHGTAAANSDTTATTATGTATSLLPPARATTSPFAPKTTTTEQTPSSSSASNGNETLMAHHAAEQEKLTESLLTLATALKSSTKTFADTLAESNPLVDRATSVLDRNASGMGAAEQRMGTLRRMTEGRGWWSRISLYAWIAVLWVAAILIVFVLPKLRF